MWKLLTTIYSRVMCKLLLQFWYIVSKQAKESSFQVAEK